MNMGQRSLQLNNTYTVNKDGPIVYHVAQMPPNANVFQPGPAFVWEDANILKMQKSRWYSSAEPLANGTITLIGGFVNCGYINRNYPNTDPATEGGAAEPTVEFFPSTGPAKQMQFMVDTSGLNSYAHAFMMPSGNTFIQANVSAMLWNPDTFAENRLPDMPNGVIRVYPASGGIAMLPLTPANNYNPTILFCGGSDMPEYEDCQRITPEPLDGSSPTSRWHYPRC